MSSSDHRRPADVTEGLVPNEGLTAVLNRLTARRRRVLAHLLEAGPLTERELAARLAADGRPRRTEDEAVDAARARLRQVDLPALEDVGLLERTDGRVDGGDALADARVRRLVEADADLEGLLECLADAIRRRLVATLADRNGPVARDDLAAELAGDGADLRAELHHRHLPKLDAHGLVEYDRESGRVRPTVSARDAEWVDLVVRA